MVEEFSQSGDRRSDEKVQREFVEMERVARDAERREVQTMHDQNDVAGVVEALKFGFRIAGIVEREGNFKFRLVKDLQHMTLPYDPALQQERMRSGRMSAYRGEEPLQAAEIAVPLALTESIVRVAAAGYIGTGIILSEHRVPHLVFQKEGTLPITEAPLLPPRLPDGVRLLREAIVNYPQGCASVTATNAINASVEKNIGTIDPLLFKRQHEAFLRVLSDREVKLNFSSAITNLEGMTGAYTRDPGGVIEDTWVVGIMHANTRQFETEAAQRTADALRQKGQKVIDLARINAERGGTATIEFGDVRPLGEKRYLVGVGQMTNAEGFRLLEEQFPDCTFAMVPHGALHLDTLLQVVDHQTVVLNKLALPQLTGELKEQGFSVISADPYETLGTNVAILRPGVVVAAAENVNTNSTLKAAGVTVIEVPMSEILKKGGGPNCIMCDTHRA